MSYLKVLNETLGSLQLSCDYWDVRVEDSFQTTISLVDGEITNCTSSPALGAFLRVRKNGFWLYESTTDLKKIKTILTDLSQQTVTSEIRSAYRPEKQPTFIKIAAASASFRNISLDEKLTLSKKYSDLVRDNKKMSGTTVIYQDIYKIKSFLNSVGTQYEYDFNQGGAYCRYTLKENDTIFEDSVRFYGSEFAQIKGQEKTILAALTESEKFLRAPSVKPGKYKVLLNPEVTGVFTHESFGHKSEADFMLGDPQALLDWKLGKKIGADCLTIVDYGGHANTSGYCPIDDDGTPAQKNYLIANGILTGRLHTVDTAAQLDEKPTGNSRAMSFEWEPMVRMTSTYIEPGTESIESLLERSENCLLVEGVKHGSGLSTFTIAPNRGYRIGPNGTKEPVRITVISGSVFETLQNVEAVSAEFKLHSSSIGGCGKMDQWPLPVSDGGPYILVKDMQVS